MTIASPEQDGQSTMKRISHGLVANSDDVAAIIIVAGVVFVVGVRLVLNRMAARDRPAPGSSS